MDCKCIKWIFLAVIIFIIILVPFMLFNNSIEIWTNHFFEASPTNLLTSLVIGILLTVDIIAPVPSSVVSTAAGYFLGFPGGTFISWIGMNLSCIIGYVIGVKFGHTATRKLVGSEELLKFEKLQRKYGDWMIIISRAIPVLAEVSVLFAGIGRMPVGRFILFTALSNLGISIVYAAVGAYSAHVNSFLVALAGAIIIPGVAMLFFKNR